MSKAFGSRGGEAQSEATSSRAAAPGKRTLVSSGGGGGDGGGFDGAGAVQQVSSSAGTPLDDRTSSQAGSLLGVDLGDVRVHTGSDSAAAADGLSANAFTHGSDIHFGAGNYQPGTSGGDHLIAHELVHVAQQKSGGAQTQLKSTEVSGHDDAAEVEADRGAAAILSGMPFHASATPAPISRDARRESLSGNPNERMSTPTPAAPGVAAVPAAPTTTHRDPTIGDSINHTAPAAAGTDARAATVRVVAGEHNKFHMEPPGCPAPDLIYQEGAQTSPPPAGFAEVLGFNGTLLQPMVTEAADKSLYIGGAPNAGDVHQMSIGDCYFESTAMSIAQRDPGKITSMMKPDGNGGATVTLWRRQAHSNSLWESIVGGPQYDYIAVDVHVSAQLAFNVGGGIHGNQLRSAPNPKASDWWSKVNTDKLEVHRDDKYEVARWAPLLEKAFARFAQQYGQYGGARPGKPANPTGSGYDTIDGGVAMYALSVIYGQQADSRSADVRREGITWTPGGNVLTANPRVVDQLILLAGRGEAAGGANAPILTAQTFEGDLVNRLGPAVNAAITDPDFNNLDPERQAAVRNVQTAWNNWNNLPPDTPGPPPVIAKATAYTAIGTACGNAVFDGAVNHGALDAVKAANPKTVQFDNEKKDVPAADDPKLVAFGTALAANPSPATTVEVTGHSSTSGADAYNLDLSQKRADEVAAKIKSGGVVEPPHTVTPVGMGETGAGPEPEWRRVDITVQAVNASNVLHDPARSVAIRAAMDLMLDLRNMGTDKSPGQRNIYGGHSYSIVGVSFVSTTGVMVPLQSVPATSRATLFPLVDTNVSNVRLRNPHHNNEPDRRGNNQATRPEDGAPTGVATDGSFTMTLEEFFRNFNAVDSGVFPRS